MWSLAKQTNGKMHHNLPMNLWEWPNTVTLAIALRQKYDTFQELTEVPPEEYWDFPFLIRRWIERIYPHMKNKSGADINPDDVEG